MLSFEHGRERPGHVNEVHFTFCVKAFRRLSRRFNDSAHLVQSHLYFKPLIGCHHLQTHQEFSSFSQSKSDDTFACWTDIPKFLTNHTIYYSWEGNPVNISCDVMSNPPATMLWRRERFTISAEGTANIRVHAAEGKSVLEVGQLRL